MAISAVLIAAGVAQGRDLATRASRTDQQRVAASIEPAFGKPSRHPTLTIVLYPICISSVDPRFAFVVANPVQRSGAVAQPGYFYLRRVGLGFHRLDPLLTARTSLTRPSTVPLRVYRDFGVGVKRLCGFQGEAAVKRVLRERSAPSFQR
jgi:hypothetical protein